VKRPKAKAVAVVALVLIVLVVTGTIAIRRMSREPSYNREPVRFWAESLSGLHLYPRLAARAIRAIGPQGVPFVFRRIHQPHSAHWRFYREQRQRLPELLRRAMPSGPRELSVTDVGPALGTIGINALPEFMEGLNDQDSDVRLAAVLAIETIAERRPIQLRGTIPILAARLTDPSSEVRIEAEICLWRINADPRVVPVLMKELELADNGATCRKIIRAFGQMGPAARAAIPAIQKKADHPPAEPSGLTPVQSVREVALEAIDRIDQWHSKTFAPPFHAHSLVEEFDTPPNLPEQPMSGQPRTVGGNH
jgi:hypothetical protein